MRILFRTTKCLFNTNYIKTKYYYKLLDTQSNQLKTNLVPKEKGDIKIDVTNYSIKGFSIVMISWVIADGIAYTYRHTGIDLTTDERKKQSI